MAEAEHPQIYLITPSLVDLDEFPSALTKVLDSIEIACLRIDLSSTDEGTVARTCDALRLVAHERDVPVTVTDHSALVERLGLDGVHLSDGAKSVRNLRKDFGSDPIIGAFCTASQHDGMNAAESGADYVSFGPMKNSGLGHGAAAEHDLFAWWSQMIEVPVVAEGSIDLETTRLIAPVTDFIALGDEVWATDDPVQTLKGYVGALS